MFLDDEPHNEKFWSTLGGEIEVTNTGECDEAAERAAKDEIKLFNVHFEDGKLETEEVFSDKVCCT